MKDAVARSRPLELGRIHSRGDERAWSSGVFKKHEACARFWTPAPRRPFTTKKGTHPAFALHLLEASLPVLSNPGPRGSWGF